MINYLKKHKVMILATIFSFYLGCILTLSFLNIDCIDAANAKNEHKTHYNEEYIVLVISSPNNVLKRDAVRYSWANLADNIVSHKGKVEYSWNISKATNKKMMHNSIKVYFAIGTKGLRPVDVKKLKTENAMNNDMLLLDIEDSYKNLSTKVLHTIRWLSENGKNLKYLIKCDDDSFVRIDLIVKNLGDFAPNMDAPEISQFISYKMNTDDASREFTGLYWGYFDGRAKVYMNGKWQEKDWFLCDHYLPYALGGGYVISQNIIQYIGRNADILSTYHSEDVSMGLWTSALDKINRVHDTRFDTQWESRGCSNDMLVRHKQTPQDMMDMYHSLQVSEGRTLCKTESTKRRAYKYNWSVLPSKCCV